VVAVLFSSSSRTFTNFSVLMAVPFFVVLSAKTKD